MDGIFFLIGSYGALRVYTAESRMREMVVTYSVWNKIVRSPPEETCQFIFWVETYERERLTFIGE